MMQANLNERKREKAHVLDALKNLKALISQRSIQKQASRDLTNRFEHLATAVDSGEAQRIVDQADMMVATVKRLMGEDLDLEIALDIADWTIEIKRPVGDPGQIYAEAAPFAFAILELAREWRRAEALLKKVRRPLPEGPQKALAAMVEKIVSLKLAANVEKPLLQGLERLTALAPEMDLKHPQGAASDEYEAVMQDFRLDLAIARENNEIATAQADELMGVALYAWPAWACYGAPAWVVQAAAIGAYGVYSAFSGPSATLMASGQIEFYISNTPGLTDAMIISYARGRVSGMSRNQILDVINNLIAYRARNPHLHDDINTALRAIRHCLNNPC